MAFVYEVNGQRVEFEKEPTEKDIDEAARSLGAPKEKTTLEKFTQPLKEMSVKDWSEKSLLAPMLQTMMPVTPFGMLKPQFAAQQSQQGAQNLGNKLTEMGKGLYHAATNPAETVQNIYNAVTERPAETAGEAVKGLIYDPEMIPGTIAGAKTLGKAAAAPVKGTYNFGKGFARGLAYPEGSSPNTALAPIRETYVPHEQVSEFMAGRRPASTLTEQPTAPLYQDKPVANWAYGMAPENQAGQKLVPYAGRTAEGVGEQIGSQYRKNPITGLVDIGTTLATGIPAPITAMARSVPALAAQRLQKATQFESGFGPAREAALAREGRMGLQQGIPPTQNLLPAPGPVNPTMFANQAGEVTATGGRPLPTQASGQPVTQPVVPTGSPKEVSQKMAMDKLQQNWQQRSGGGYQPPMATPQPSPVTTQPVAPQPMPQTKAVPQPVPVVKNVRSSSQIKQELEMLGNQSDELHQRGLESGIKYGTPEGESHQAQLGQLHARTKVLEKELEEVLKAEKKATKQANKQVTPVQKKGPSNVSQMLIGDEGPKIYPNKQAFEKESIFSTLKDKPHTGSYIQGDKIIHVEQIDYGTMPKDITKDFQQTKTYATDKQGNRVPIGKEWTDADPEPLTSKLKRKFKRED